MVIDFAAKKRRPSLHDAANEGGGPGPTWGLRKASRREDWQRGWLVLV